jgi:hypothetical protein
MPIFKLSIWMGPIYFVNWPHKRWTFRPFKYLLKVIHAHSMGVQGVFNTHSLAFMPTHKHSGNVQYSLKGIQGHSQVFRGHSLLTQMRSFSCSYHGESHSIMTQWWSCVLIGCSHLLNGGHASMGVQGLFPLTHWCSCTLNGCSETVQYSLIGIHMHSQAFRGHSILTQGIQLVQTLEVPIDMFSNMQSTLRPYKYGHNFHWMPFLWMHQTRRLDVTLEYMIGRWSWCLQMRSPTNNKKVGKQFRKLGISQVLLN